MALSINPDYFPKNTNASQSMAGKNLLLYIAYGEGATVEDPIWNLVGGQRNSPLSMSADEIDAVIKAPAAGVKRCRVPKPGVLNRNAYIKLTITALILCVMPF